MAKKQSKKSASKAKQPKDTRQVILDTAAVLFRERGYEGTSMNALATKVGVRPASIYYHFASKNDILFAFLKDTGEGLIKACKETVDNTSGSAVEKLRAFIKAHAVFEIDMLEIMPLVDTNVFRAINLTNALTKKQRNYLVKGQREIVEILRQILVEGQEAGELEFDDLTVTIYAILGPIEHLVYWYRRKGKLTPEQVAEKLSYLLIRSVSPSK